MPPSVERTYKLCADLRDDFYLYGGVQRQCGHADSCASMHSRLAEDLSQQLGSAIDYAGLATKAGGGGNKTIDLYNSFNVFDSHQIIDRGNGV